jgi:hypothetical protein
MKIYKILENFYLGETLEYPDEEEGIPFGYTRKEPPELTESEQTKYVRWSGMEWEITDEEPPVPPLPPKVISKLGFINRLGDDDYVAILTASKTDVEIEAWINKFILVSNIDLNDTKTQEWIAKFVAKNLLTQEKADKILQDPLQPLE